MRDTGTSYKGLLLFFFFICFIFLLPNIPGNEYDMYCFTSWAKYIQQKGFVNAYGSRTDYPPLYQYFLWFLGKVYSTPAAIDENQRYMSLCTLVTEAFGLYYVYKWIDKKLSFSTLLLVNFLNIAFLYNTLVWGQVDGILATLLLLAIYYVHKQKFVTGSIWYGLAVLMKLQAIIYFPVFFLVLFSGTSFNSKAIMNALKAAGVIVLVVAIFTAPFFLDTEDLWSLKHAIIGSVGRFPYLSMNAYNIYYAIVGHRADVIMIEDTTNIFGAVSYKLFGLALFCTTSFFAMLPIMKFIIKKWRDKLTDVFPRHQVWLLCALIPILFFYCNTQMHERYAHPAFIFIIAYSFFTKDFIPYILFSIAYLLNLDRVMGGLHFKNYYTAIYDARFVAGLYLLLIGYLYYRIYVPHKVERADSTQPALNSVA